MKKEKRMVETKYYKFVNLNPKGKFTEDCVIRAIANAMDISWEEAINKLTQIGLKKGYVCNDDKCYPILLENNGFNQMKQPKKYDGTKITIAEFIEKELDKNYIVVVRCKRHLTCIRNKKVEDIWNCSNEYVGKYWIKRIG